jgi:[ribosomal protein S5]-alanine N-acetyltransferase
MAVNGDPEVTQLLPYATWAGMPDALSWFNRMQALQTVGSGVQLVVQAQGSGRVVGTVLLFKLDEPSARLELGYVLARASWGQGLKAEALSAVVARCFAIVKLRRVEAEVNPDNVASNKLLAKLGFVLEGRVRQRWVAKGVAYDTNLYGLLVPGWRAGAA